MADIKLNEFGAVTSIAKLLGLDSSGNGKYITSENFLANTFKDRGSIPNGMDLNTYSYGMYYSFPENGTVLNGPSFNRFILICFRSGSHFVQFAVSVHPGSYAIQYRTSYNGGENWSAWKSITIT